MKLIRRITRILWLILFVIVLVLVLAGCYRAWTLYCTQPEEVVLSDEITALLQDSRDNSIETILFLYRQVSHELAWHGSSSLYFLNFNEICKADECSILSLDMIMEFEHHLACAWATSRFNHSLVSVKIANFSTPTIETYISELRWGEGGYRPSPISFVAEMGWVQNRALQALPNHYRQRSQIVYLNYWGYLNEDGDFPWLMNVRLAGSGESQSPKVAHPSPLQAIRARLRQDWQ